MKDILKLALVACATIVCSIFVFTTKSQFESLAIAMLYAVFMEIEFPKKGK